MTDRDRDQPLQFRIADACLCGSIFRVNVAASRRQARQAVSEFRARHIGEGHGPAEVVLDRRTLDRRDLPGWSGRV